MSAIISSPFTRFAKKTTTFKGKPIAFIFAVSVICAWAIPGPLFDFSDTWRLVIHTSINIISLRCS